MSKREENIGVNATEKKESSKVDVLIGGDVITLRSTEEPEYLHRLARYIDKKITDVTKASQSAAIDERVRTLLIALNVADDYFKVIDGFTELEGVQKKFAKEMGRMQKENTLLQQRINELQEELGKTRSELDEFIQNFDQLTEEEKADNILPMRPDARKAAR